MNYLQSVFVLLCLTLTTTVNAQNKQISKQDSILGNWSILSNQAAVAISVENGIFSGQLIWLATPNDKHGLPRLDVQNIEKRKRNRPILQMICLYNFAYNPTSGNWENGYFYNPFTGDTIKATLEMIDSNTIIISGFAGFSLRFETETWTRF